MAITAQTQVLESSNLPRNERLDLVLENFGIENNIKGIAASVNIGDETIWKGNYGVSHDTFQIDSNSLFGLASITKTFVATIILQLYEEGMLNINDSVSKWLPPIEYVDPAITIAQLLNHSSGVYDFAESASGIWDTAYMYPEKVWTPLETMEYLDEPYFQPGTGNAYSNSNYILLGMVIESVTGQSFVDELQARILTPLGLTNTFLGPFHPSFEDVTHTWTGSEDVTDIKFTVSVFTLGWTAGSLISTSTDVADFYTSLLYDKILINDTSVQLMVDNKYGIFTRDVGRFSETTQAAGHRGGGLGIRTSVYHYAEDSVTVSVLTNHDAFDYSLTDKLYLAVNNFAPTDIILSEDSITDNIEPGYSVGYFFTADTNSHGQNDFTYSLVGGDGENDQDNDCFSISGRNLKINCTLDHSVQSEYRILVQSVDGYGGSVIKPFVLQVTQTPLAVEAEINNVVRIYPNPAHDQLNIVIGAAETKGMIIELYNAGGKMIYRKDIKSYRSYFSDQIDVTGIDKGLYLLKIRLADKVYTERIVLQ